MDMPRTRVEAELAEAERVHADDGERAELLARARRFKASWVELAEALSACRKASAWRRWGFASFDEYTRKELHLRPETVDKLTGSYSFLRARAPEVLARGPDEPIPSWQSVDFLRRAEEKEGAPAEAVAELRRRVIDDGAALPSLTRKYREVIFPLADEEKADRDARQLRSAARRLAELLEGSGAVPRRLAREVGEAVARLIEALGDDDASGDASGS
jgi:hypothetical protein